MRIKLKSFTLIELMVVMLISAIVIVLAGGVFYNLSQYKVHLNAKAIPVNNMAKFRYLLELDNMRSEKVEVNGDTLIFSGINSSTYLVLDTVVIREQGNLIDTFQIVSGLTDIKMEEGLVESCNITIRDHHDRESNILLTKYYSSEQLLKFTKDNEPQ